MKELAGAPSRTKSPPIAITLRGWLTTPALAKRVLLPVPSDVDGEEVVDVRLVVEFLQDGEVKKLIGRELGDVPKEVDLLGE